jgi:Uma2 family endonuclease
VRLFDRHKSLIANREIFSVVQPDISVICDKTKIDSQGCLGAPDWVIEILSKGNSKKEMQLKYQLYQESGVKEYWLIYPYEKAVHQFVLDDNSEKYQLLNMYCGEDIATPHLFPNLQINLNEIFEDSFN